MRLGSLALLLGLIALTLLIFGSIETLRIAPLVAKVTEVKGEALALLPPKLGREKLVERPLKVGSLILSGTTVKTGKGSFIVLHWVDEFEMRIGPETQLKVKRSSFNRTTKALDTLFKLDLGTVFVKLKRKLPARSRLELETPSITAAVCGTAYEVSVDPEGTTTLKVRNGTVTVRTVRGEELKLTGGRAIVVNSDGKVSFIDRSTNNSLKGPVSRRASGKVAGLTIASLSPGE